MHDAINFGLYCGGLALAYAVATVAPSLLLIALGGQLADRAVIEEVAR